QDHVRIDLRHDLDRLPAVAGLGHHFHAIGQGQQRTYALPDQRLVVDKHDSDRNGTHGVTPSLATTAAAAAVAGNVNDRRKPACGRVSIVRSPPSWTSRSRMPRRPLPETSW